MPASSGSSERPITVYGAIAANAVIGLSKFAAGIISGSSAMLSEAIHSVVDTGNELCSYCSGSIAAENPPMNFIPSVTGRNCTFGA